MPSERPFGPRAYETRFNLYVRRVCYNIVKGTRSEKGFNLSYITLDYFYFLLKTVKIHTSSCKIGKLLLNLKANDSLTKTPFSQYKGHDTTTGSKVNNLVVLSYTGKIYELKGIL